MNGPTLGDILLGLLPMLLLIGAWYVFMRRMGSGTYLAEMKQQTVVLERIAAALEKRNDGTPPPAP